MIINDYKCIKRNDDECNESNYNDLNVYECNDNECNEMNVMRDVTMIKRIK